MRAGPLSDQIIVDLLNKEFINTWVVLAQLEKPEEHFTSDEGRRWAKVVRKEYVYPVQTQVYSATGQVFEKLAINTLFENPFEDWGKRYHNCLTKSLESAKVTP